MCSASALDLGVVNALIGRVLWQRFGITVERLRRGGEIIESPPDAAELRVDDDVVMAGSSFVSTRSARRKRRRWAKPPSFKPAVPVGR